MRTQPLLLLLMLSACTDSDAHDSATKYGELGVGAFLYRCPASGDPACPNGASTAPTFPRAIASGSQIDLEYTWQDDEDHRNDPLPQLQSAMSARLRNDGSRFTALEPGFVAVIAVTGNSEVVDFMHLEIAKIDELWAIPADEALPVPLAKLDLITNEERTLQGLVVDAGNTRLGGILPYSWASDDPGVLELVSGSNSGLVRIRAVSSGVANLTLTQGERTLTLPVSVTPGLDDSTTTGDGGTDASTGDTTGSTDTSTGTTADSDGSGSSTDTTGGVL